MEPHGARAGNVLVVVGQEYARRPDCAAADTLHDAHHARHKARPHRLHDEHALTVRRLGDLPRLYRAERERLFYQHVFSRLDRQQCITGVHGVGRRNVDDVDAGIGYQRLVAAVALRDFKAIRELVGRGGRA